MVLKRVTGESDNTHLEGVLEDKGNYRPMLQCAQIFKMVQLLNWEVYKYM